tara:strand:- start:44429 stop:44698 length:270 start_codon:yes stop_codon:yes gene_type:complete
MNAEQQQEETKVVTEIMKNFNIDPNISLGENIDKFVKTSSYYTLMNEDNKKMLEKVKQSNTDKEVIATLMTDPDSGRSMSYAESRMRFG